MISSHCSDPLRLGVDDRQGFDATMHVSQWRETMSLAQVDRGVYWARYRKNGRPIAYAVDSKGDVVRRYVVMHDSRCEAAVEALWDYLDVVDPVGVLQLVRCAPVLELPSTARRGRLETFDPYAEGPLLYGRRRHH